MKKIFAILILFLMTSSAFGINYGMYKPETNYGLIDGFKFNFKSREKGQKFVELKSETKEEQAKLERESKKPQKEIDENEQFRFIRDGVVAY